MKTTNEIEAQLVKKVQEEINETVQRFLSDLERLEKKYGCEGRGYYDLTNEAYTTTSMSLLNRQELEHAIKKGVYNKLGDKMVAVKTNQLLEKLDLI